MPVPKNKGALRHRPEQKQKSKYNLSMFPKQAQGDLSQIFVKNNPVAFSTNNLENKCYHFSQNQHSQNIFKLHTTMQKPGLLQIKTPVPGAGAGRKFRTHN